MMNNNVDSVTAARDQENDKKDNQKKSDAEGFDYSVSCYVMDKKNNSWSKLFTTGCYLIFNSFNWSSLNLDKNDEQILMLTLSQDER